MMEIIIAVLLLFGTSLFLTEPFFKEKKNKVQYTDSKQQSLRKLDAKKTFVAECLSDLELEHRSGMVTEEDYKTLSEGYREQLAKLSVEIKSLDSGGNGKNLRERIEQDIMDRRKQKTDSAAENCPECKSALEGAVNFCSHCGAKLK
ncbi:hypothetical protein ACFL67_03885 [candidate division KSB1 bacterium]